jgi:hypothetical protein
MVDFQSAGAVGLGGGSPGVRQGLYTNQTTQAGPVGAKMEFGGGEVFRYCYFVTAVAAGKLAALDTSVAIQTSFNAAFVNSAGAAKDDYGTDDNSIYVKTSDITSDDTANIWADGWLMITDAAGEGMKYRIQGHEAGSATTANVMRLDLYDNIAVALDSESSACIVGSKYSNLAIANAGTDDICVGIPALAAAATSYGWAQTRGTSLVLADEAVGTIAAGTIAVLSDGVDGAATVFGQGSVNSEEELDEYTTEPLIGHFMTAAVDTEYVAINLTNLAD